MENVLAENYQNLFFSATFFHFPNLALFGHNGLLVDVFSVFRDASQWFYRYSGRKCIFAYISWEENSLQNCKHQIYAVIELSSKSYSNYMKQLAQNLISKHFLTTDNLGIWRKQNCNV